MNMHQERTTALPRSHLCSLCIVLALAWAEPATAQPSDEEELALVYGEKNFVSIATGTRQPLRKAPSAATVITAADIAAMGATTLAEALEAVPGMHVSSNSLQNNYTPTYGMRGILTGSAPHVLLMVNGVPRTGTFLGTPQEFRGEMPVENIARIEIIRGPGSALYGADAFAGTINVITRTAAETSGSSFGLRAASFNRREAWFQHGSKDGELEIAGYLKIATTDGQRRTIQADAQTTIDALGLSPAVSLAPGPVNLGHDSIDGQIDLAYGKFRLRAGYSLLDNAGTGVGIAGALDPTGRIRSERISSDLSWNDATFGRDLSLTMQAYYMQIANEVITPLVLFPPGAFFGTFPNGMIGDPDKWERQLRLSAASVYSGFADHRLRFGLGHDDLNLYKTRESKNFTQIPGPLPTPLPMYVASGANLYLAPHRRNVNYAYLQDEWGFARDWTLTAGVRYDHYSDFGGTTNPRLALVWEARHDLTAKLLYGTAFRAPSFVEQYAAGNPVALGNPSLMPEKITTFEGVLTWQAGSNLHTSLSLFRHELSDIISQSGVTYLNTGRQKGHGGEFELTWDPATSLRLSGNYAYQKNVDQTTRQDSGYAPHHHLYSRAEWRFTQGWLASAQLNWVADRKRVAGDPRPDVPDYTSVDLTLRSDQPKHGWDFAASLHNAFDADIREPSRNGSGITFDLPMPGRTFWLQARYTL